MKTKIKGNEYWYTFERKIICFVDRNLSEGDEVHFNVRFIAKLENPRPQIREACEKILPQMETCPILTKMED